MNLVVSNLLRVKERIQSACLESGRDPSTVMLLAVSKTKPIEMLQIAMAEGQNAFGESYVQDAIAKITVLPNASWHFIGNIQSNKTQLIANNFDWVHSLASLKIAKRLNDQRERKKALNILLQVNISKDPKKAGIQANTANEFLKAIEDMEKLKLRGLMTIIENTKDQRQQRAQFARLSKLHEELNSKYVLPDFNQLSMGMTQDLEAAIAEGATIVRIGTDIFGAREKLLK
ncbi:MAG: YggS family pyridoxal phosphate-dependent enzyme [Candidatus Azotimanducaceae bacterium]|uniref:Pyridoxal phosphate homeostasis protein n=1 Tax=OM182 bacterium TaxID=2510334 RepID=A0A520S5K1_9GAMM|nr:YggS family pyridoxal phosphate-dependent enzyme [Gammaproteobacteria bacterium]OUV68676.1 MAG: YggS family pyridoxal phosphate enzyme [Gammaproteobacteria bacterium TMED133]RZO77679.1 MAG: YggS family pyridoxal phosphate-dependent enzyme [OM182 bacterium]